MRSAAQRFGGGVQPGAGSVPAGLLGVLLVLGARAVVIIVAEAPVLVDVEPRRRWEAGAPFPVMVVPADAQVPFEFGRGQLAVRSTRFQSVALRRRKGEHRGVVGTPGDEVEERAPVARDDLRRAVQIMLGLGETVEPAEQRQRQAVVVAAACARAAVFVPRDDILLSVDRALHQIVGDRGARDQQRRVPAEPERQPVAPVAQLVRRLAAHADGGAGVAHHSRYGERIEKSNARFGDPDVRGRGVGHCLAPWLRTERELCRVDMCRTGEKQNRSWTPAFAGVTDQC